MKNLILLILSFLMINPSFAGEEPLFKVDTSTNKLPREFFDLDNRLYELDKDRPYEVVLVLANDLGVGDDYGHTHDLRIIGVTKLKSGIRLSVSYSTDLYTEKIGEKNDDGLTPQHFLDENIGKFMADNIEAGKLYYWKAEAGWHQLSDVPSKNIFRASAQQVLFHKLINPFIPQKQPLNVSEGFGQHDGAVGGVSVGVQKNFQHGALNVHPQIEVGISQSTIQDASYKYASASLETTYVVRPEYRVNAVIQSEVKNHSTGTQYTHSINTSLEMKNWVVGAGVYAMKGTLQNHTRYNKPNSNGKIDPIYMVYGSYRFGKGSKSAAKLIRPKELLRK